MDHIDKVVCNKFANNHKLDQNTLLKWYNTYSQIQEVDTIAQMNFFPTKLPVWNLSPTQMNCNSLPAHPLMKNQIFVGSDHTCK
jgi:hypothetical protein